MKKLFKTIVALSAASAMMLSTTAMAATTSTVTKYTTSATTVTSTVTGLTENSMVTYLAVQGEDGTVAEDGSNIVYIGQQTVDSTKSATFDYDITSDIGDGTYAVVKYGSNVDTISGTNTVAVGSVNVTWSGCGELTGTATGDVLVGTGDEGEITLTAPDGYSIVDIKVGEVHYDSLQATVPVKANDEVVVTVVANDTAAVYQLVGAKVEATDETSLEIYKNSGIVRVFGSVGSVYFTFNDGTGNYTMNGEQPDGKFYVDGINGSGYYGVEIEDTTDVSAYAVTAAAETADGESITVEMIQ